MKEYKNFTIDFFDNYLNEYEVYISEIVFLEINKTKDIDKKNKLLNAIKKYHIEIFDVINNEIELLANRYLETGVIPENKYEDALHIAFSTYYDFDILLSWNFRHLANIKKQAQINSINKIEGYYKELNLYNPMEVMYEK